MNKQTAIDSHTQSQIDRPPCQWLELDWLASADDVVDELMLNSEWQGS